MFIWFSRKIVSGRMLQPVFLHKVRLLSASVSLQQKAVVSAKQPFAKELVSGKKYSWCACGLSNKQPFCDGSHKKTGMRPVRITAEESCEVYFCGCKQTKTPPYCDGTHMGDDVQQCEIGKPL